MHAEAGGTLAVKINIPDKKVVLKAFLWDGIKTMRPVSGAVLEE